MLLTIGSRSLSLRLVFLLTERWSVLRLTEGIKRELMTKDLHHVRILPGDVEELTASVRHSPVVEYSHPITKGAGEGRARRWLKARFLVHRFT
jgi:hypothetical protein